MKKQLLRQLYKQKREDLSAEQAKDLSSQIDTKLLELLSDLPSNTLREMGYKVFTESTYKVSSDSKQRAPDKSGKKSGEQSGEKSTQKSTLSKINCYLSSSKKKELSTKNIINQLHLLKKDVSVPLSYYTNYDIQAVVFKPEDEIMEDQFGIPTPIKIKIISTHEIEVVIIPLLCFDKNGFRCGYGKGMYDRFLAKCKPETIKIGLSFFDPIDKISDINEQDIKMNYVVTPNSIIKFQY